MKKSEYLNRVPIAKDNICIYRDNRKCRECGACKGICGFRIGVYGHYDMEKAKEPICINCGQCSLVCPYGSIKERKDYLKVREEIQKGRNVIVQIAPSSRFLVGEEFGYKVGKNVIGKMVSSLKKIGVKYVVDTTYGADLTICEEATELINRLKKQEKLPLFTSCCPAWVKYVNYFYLEYVDNLSSTKSPIQMTGAVIKNYYAPKKKIDDVLVVAIVPCTAKKYEITKSDDVDYAITVREFAEWVRLENIQFRKMPNDKIDMLTGTSSGLIFGSSGGVMEAMLRYTYHKLTGANPPKKLLNFVQIRGLTDVKEADLKIKDYNLKIAVINGTGDVPSVIKKIKEEGIKYDVIEVMACDGGCIAGGGSPKVYKITNTNKNIRSKAIYKSDNSYKRKSSYENKSVKKLYKEYLGKPNSELAKKILHNGGNDE